ncbi:hypothetical protein SFRURICE_003859 [Spodoptera frugiperda]|nr:hypothetical protein SFRURICE_003859 [Spodoptera frugiperda]
METNDRLNGRAPRAPRIVRAYWSAPADRAVLRARHRLRTRQLLFLSITSSYELYTNVSDSRGAAVDQQARIITARSRGACLIITNHFPACGGRVPGSQRIAAFVSDMREECALFGIDLLAATADNSARGGGGASDIVLKTRSLQITEHCFYFSWVLIKTIPRRVRAASATTSDVGVTGGIELPFPINFEFPIERWPCSESLTISQLLLPAELFQSRSITEYKLLWAANNGLLYEPVIMARSRSTWLGYLAVCCEVVRLVAPSVHKTMYRLMFLFLRIDGGGLTIIHNKTITATMRTPPPTGDSGDDGTWRQGASASQP